MVHEEDAKKGSQITNKISEEREDDRRFVCGWRRVFVEVCGCNAGIREREETIGEIIGRRRKKARSAGNAARKGR